MSMKIKLQEENDIAKAPFSLIVSGFAPVVNIHKTMTLQLRPKNRLFFLNLSNGKQKLVDQRPHKSGGGLLTTIAETSFAGHVGMNINLENILQENDIIRELFNEELGAVIQISQQNLEKVK
ncbi:6575_t:CDS:2 [Diversispora eburnea]|uniref:6575_t:CDS:1 n=1 Tax=Diversispora eburnea TaxID=1213867 RepID=A0A9N8YTU1_9GLOM|nr:6575_t:CDS:2 [Diversispora eburnea]